jgi:hypothetical protein
MEKIWADASAKYVVEQGNKVRENAAKWGQSATGILAAAGLATAFKGTETLEALPEATRGSVSFAIIAAAVLAGIALLLAAWAASGTTGWAWNDPESFRTAQTTAAQSASNRLNWSVVILGFAFVASIWAVTLIWTSPKPASAEQTLVIGPNGLVGCGKLSADDGQLVVDNEPVPPPPVSFHTTSDCPD